MTRPEKVSHGVVRTCYPVDHHAFGIRAEYFDEILKTWRVGNGKTKHDGTAVDLPRTNSDVELARLAKEIPMYACYPNIAWQRKDVSDQSGRNYSNYTPEGDQLYCRDVVAGLGAEVLGGRRWQGLPLANQTPGRWDDAEKTGLPCAGAGIRDFLKELEQTPVPDPKATPSLAVLLPGVERPHHFKLWSEFAEELTGSGGRLYLESTSGMEVERELPGATRVKTAKSPGPDGTGCLRAMLALLKEALEDPMMTHFVFTSGGGVPVMPYREMRRLLRVDGRPWLKVRNLDKLWETDKNRARRMLAAPAIEKGSWRDHAPSLLLDRETALLIVEDDFTEHFAQVESPQECYFGTVLRLKGYPVEELCAQKEVRWTRGRGLRTVNPIRAGEIARSGCFFAGDFPPESNIEDFGLHRDSAEVEVGA